MKRTPGLWQVSTRCKITFGTSGAVRMPYEICKRVTTVEPGCFAPFAFAFTKEDADFIAAGPAMADALKEIYRLEMGGPAGNIAEEILKQLGEL
jgi:hypothetical protein